MEELMMPRISPQLKILPAAINGEKLVISGHTKANKKAQFGQFFTPEAIAVFMAKLFPDSGGCCRLLDAGAGIGSLSAAFLARWQAGGFHFQNLQLDAFEVDQIFIPPLTQNLEKYANELECFVQIKNEDFIHAAIETLSGDLFSQSLKLYTHVILNPPYKKISSNSMHRLALRRVGIETVNLYSAFVALAIALIAPNGQIVAIIPRSFCNGPYYRPFRNIILEHTAIQHIHLFESRKAFKDDAVLQENIIIRLERGSQQSTVTISHSTDEAFTDLTTNHYSFDQIVLPNDPEKFIHIPKVSNNSMVVLHSKIDYTLTDLGITASTGPVVDFRLKEYLRNTPSSTTVPLLYPCHFVSYSTVWPIDGVKKPNAIERNADTEKWLYPNGYYCVVRRLSSKEEKRRIIASVVEPNVFGNASMLGFENHLNLLHDNKHSLLPELAYGLAVFLNSTMVDEIFRRFNGNTQVNATDLKRMKYPSRAILIELGEWAMQQIQITQMIIDTKLEALFI